MLTTPSCTIICKPEDSSEDVIGWRLQSPQGTSNALSIHLADAPVILEQEPNNESAKAQQITVPTEITGQFQEKLDADWYQFTAKAGEVYAIEAYGQRLGKQTDPRFIVEQVTVNDKGEESVKRLTDQDDVKTTIGGDDFNTRHRDPAWMLTVPADGAYRVMINDRYREKPRDPTASVSTCHSQTVSRFSFGGIRINPQCRRESTRFTRCSLAP